MESHVNSHYGSAYFRWQRQLGELGGLANLYKFARYVDARSKVIDFGRGGGYLLANLRCGGKVGVDPNPTALQEARGRGLTCYESCEPIEDGWADVVVSNSVLEHTACPLNELIKLRQKLRNGGLAVFSVAHETLNWRYAPGDINQHLYTWSPMAVGNLLPRRDSSVKVKVIKSDWPPYVGAWVLRVFGTRTFRVICRLYWVLRRCFNWLRPMRVDADLVVVARNP